MHSAALTIQIAETAFANARLSVEQRLARWIELAHKRLRADVMTFSHVELSAAIGCNAQAVIGQDLEFRDAARKRRVTHEVRNRGDHAMRMKVDDVEPRAAYGRSMLHLLRAQSQTAACASNKKRASPCHEVATIHPTLPG